jgi:hypothetical protein
MNSLSKNCETLSEPDGLIVCFGRIVDDLCAAAISEIGLRYPEHHFQFVMSEWLTIDQFARALAFWVVDSAVELADIAPALQYGIPLLVPEASTVLKDACIAGNYGLFYQTRIEAMACLAYLAGHPDVRAFLARNAAASSYRLAMAGAR